MGIRVYVLVLFTLLCLFVSTKAVFSAAPTDAPRITACDLCGYCPPNPQSPPTEEYPIPQRWEACRDCLYPATKPNPPNSNLTVIIDAFTGTGPTPYPGRMFTFLGCISTPLGNFSQEGSAAGFVQTLLNVIFAVVGTAAFLYLIYGSYLLLTSQGDTLRLRQGKLALYRAIVGLVFAVMSTFIVNTIISILKIPGF